MAFGNTLYKGKPVKQTRELLYTVLKQRPYEKIVVPFSGTFSFEAVCVAAGYKPSQIISNDPCLERNKIHDEVFFEHVAEFSDFQKAVYAISKRFKVRNTPMILARMAKLAIENLNAQEEQE